MKSGWLQSAESIYRLPPFKRAFCVKPAPLLICELDMTPSHLQQRGVTDSQEEYSIIMHEVFDKLPSCQKVVVNAMNTGDLPNPVQVFQAKLHIHLKQFFSLQGLMSRVRHTIVSSDESKLNQTVLLSQLTVTDSLGTDFLTLSCLLTLPNIPAEKLVFRHLKLEMSHIIPGTLLEKFSDQLCDFFPTDTFYADIYRLTYFGSLGYAFFEDDGIRRWNIYPPFSNGLLTKAESINVSASLFYSLRIDALRLQQKIQQPEYKANMLIQLASDLPRLTFSLEETVLDVSPKTKMNAVAYLKAAIQERDIVMTDEQHLLLCYLLIQGFLNPHNNVEVELGFLLAQQGFFFSAKKNPGQQFCLRVVKDGDFELTTTREYKSIDDTNKDSIFSSEHPFLTVTTNIIIPRFMANFDITKATSQIVLAEHTLSPENKLGQVSAYLHVKHKIWPILKQMQIARKWNDYRCTLQNPVH